MTHSLLLRTGTAVLVVGGVLLPGGAAEAKTARAYANCTALHRDYPHGVGRHGARDRVRGRTDPVTTWAVDTRVYGLNTKSDRDKDGVACEQH